MHEISRKNVTKSHKASTPSSHAKSVKNINPLANKNNVRAMGNNLTSKISVYNSFGNQPLSLQKKCSTCSSTQKLSFSQSDALCHIQRNAEPIDADIQTQLTIGRADDKFEREADSVADKITQRLANAAMNHQANHQVDSVIPVSTKKTNIPINTNKTQKTTAPLTTAVSHNTIRKMETTNDEKDAVDPKDTIQRKQCSACADPPEDQTNSISDTFRTSLNHSKGRGRELPVTIKMNMEAAFAADFSQVRIHTGDTAINMTNSLHAQAFTHGSDIYFNRGKFNHSHFQGKHLLAHELAHTLQQGSTIRLKPGCNNSEWKKWNSIIDKEIGGKRWGKTQPEKEEIKKRVRALPDANKIKVRDMIDECIREDAGDQRQRTAETLADPITKAKLPAHQKKIRSLCDKAIKRIRDFRRNSANASELKKRSDELDKREQLLLLLKKATDNESFAADDYVSSWNNNNQSLNEELATSLADLSKKYREQDLDFFTYLFNLAAKQGFATYTLGLSALSRYSGYFSFTRGDLKPKKDLDKPTEGTGVAVGNAGKATPSGTGTTANSTAGKPKVEPVAIPDQGDLGKLQKFLRELEKSDLPGEQADPAELARLVEMLSQQDLEEFKAFYKAFLISHDEETEGALTVDKALAKFLDMSEVEREILRTNRSLKKQDESAPPPSTDRIELSVEKNNDAHDKVEALNKKLEQYQYVPGGDSDRKKEFAPLDNGMMLFLEEMAILDGLIDGAKRQSTDIADAAKGFWNELDKFRDNLITEMQWIAGQLVVEAIAGAILTYISGGTLGPVIAVKIALLVKKLNTLRKLIQKAQRIIAIFETIKNVIETVSKAGQAYENFRKQFEDGLRRFRAIEKRIESLDGDEALDEEYNKLQEELLEKIQTQLDGQLGELLQHFFIPPDTSEDQLMKILMDIPEGIDSLKRVHKRYQRGRGKATPGEFARLLYIMSTDAGFKLYPLVGFLTAKAGENLNSLNAELQGKTTADRMGAGLERLVNKSKKHRKKGASDRKKGIRGLFEKIRPNKYNYNKSDLNTVLKKGETWMNTEFDTMEKGAEGGESFNGFWTKALFRFTVRKKVKELNAIRGKFGDVRATLKSAKKGSSGAKVEKKVTPPRFKTRWSSIFDRKNNFFFFLELNPKSGKIPKKLARPLTYTSFKGAGIPFKPKNSKKKKSLYQWLDNEGYIITPNVKGKSLIRHSSRGKGPRGKTFFLQVDHDGTTAKIRQDRKLSITKKYIPDFYGRLVNTDKDIPEGYVLYTVKGSEGIRARKGLAWVVRKFPLGIDDKSEIVGKDKKFPIVQTKTVKKAEKFNDILDPESIADKMFEADKIKSKPEYNVKKRSYLWWRNHIRGRKELQQRPTFKHYMLGNVKYARSVGDLLSSRSIPELKYGDDRGHLIAKRFGGSDDYDNLIPMNSTLNRSNSKGSWYRVEGDMAKEFRRGRKKVEVKINIHYPSAKSRRPHRFSGSYEVLKFDTSTKIWGRERAGNFPKSLKQ